MASIYLNYIIDSACPLHRLLMPARFCSQDYAPMGHRIDAGEGLPAGYDAYFFHGIPNTAAIVEFAKLKRQGKKFICGIDDAWEHIPEWSPAHPSEEAMAIHDLVADMADVIAVSTPGVKKAMAKWADKIVVTPNMLDLKMFPSPPSWELDAQGKPTHAFTVSLPVRVCWVGGHTHKGDIEVLEGVVNKTLKAFGKDRVVFVYFGMSPPASLIRDHLHKGLFYQPPVPFPSYQATLNSIKADVYLAPLAKIPFNESKSNLRIIEGWSLMACPIATKIGEYECIRPGVDGRTVDSEDEWMSALSRIVTDHQYRLGMALEGRQRVEREYDWNRFDCRRPWHELFSRVFECDLPTRRE